MKNEPITLVCSTREREDLFSRSTYLGRSLEHFPSFTRPKLYLVAENYGENTRGLSEIYNEAIENASPNELLVFIHDDVYIHDWFLESRIREGLAKFDVLGVAGASNPDFEHPSWGLKFTDELIPNGWQDELIRSGAVNHFDYACPKPSEYGASPMQCKLIDGLFIAVRASRIKSTGVRFDPSFLHHLYDLDFCRSADKAGLSIGTWPISITHNSGGDFHSPEFRESAKRYLVKWA